MGNVVFVFIFSTFDISEILMLASKMLRI